MIYLKIVICTFAALWLPIALIGGLFLQERIEALLSVVGEWPQYVLTVGLVWILIDLWRSKKTQDDKIWWTVLGVFLAPIVVPAYWFGSGLNENLNRLKAEQIDDGNSVKPPGDERTP